MLTTYSIRKQNVRNANNIAEIDAGETRRRVLKIEIKYVIWLDLHFATAKQSQVFLNLNRRFIDDSMMFYMTSLNLLAFLLGWLRQAAVNGDWLADWLPMIHLLIDRLNVYHWRTIYMTFTTVFSTNRFTSHKSRASLITVRYLHL